MNERYRIEYLDHNEDFAQLLPREGTVISQHTTSSGVDDWFLLELDEPLEYQIEENNGTSWRLLQVDRFLIRSRWEGYPINGEKPTSVFIILIEKEMEPPKEGFEVNNYFHVAWGMAHKIDCQQGIAHNVGKR